MKEGVGGEYVTCLGTEVGGRRLMWREKRVGGQGVAYNMDEVINRLLSSGRTRKITMVVQSHSALHEVRAAESAARARTQRTQNAPSERFVLLGANGPFVPHWRVGDRFRFRSWSRLGLGALGTSGGPGCLCTSTGMLTPADVTVAC